MAKLLIGSIDLSKIDKSKIVTTGKDGQPFKNGGKFINIAVWLNDEPDQFGNHASIQMGDKDNKIYIGNLKEYQRNEYTNTTSDDRAEYSNDGSLPF